LVFLAQETITLVFVSIVLTIFKLNFLNISNVVSYLGRGKELDIAEVGAHGHHAA
jgi:hypothetical protein